MILALPNLTYLEDRPVFDYERLFSDAWKKGGKEAEAKAREEWKANQRKRLTDFQSFGKKEDEDGKKRRKMAMKRMMDEL